MPCPAAAQRPLSQGEHAVWLDSYFPAGQRVHVPPAGSSQPAEHSEQPPDSTEAPGSEDCPVAQATHSVAALLSSSNCPAGQSAHSSTPSLAPRAENLPAAQTAHSVCRLALAAVPAAQSSQAVPESNWPMAQSSHDVRSAAGLVPASHGTHWRNIPGTSPNVPAGQSEHS